MATRLYPNTENPSKLEKLAGVTAGTHARLQKLLAEEPQNTYSTEYETWWDKKNEDSEVNKLHHFQLYGWGRITGNVFRIVGDDAGGSTDPMKCRQICAAQKLPQMNFDDYEGLSWS